MNKFKTETCPPICVWPLISIKIAEVFQQLQEIYVRDARASLIFPQATSIGEERRSPD